MRTGPPSPADTAVLIRGTTSDLGEGPVWDEHRGKLLLLDLTGGVLHLNDPVTGADQQQNLVRSLGSVVLDALRAAAAGCGPRELIADAGYTTIARLAAQAAQIAKAHPWRRA